VSRRPAADARGRRSVDLLGRAWRPALWAAVFLSAATVVAAQVAPTCEGLYAAAPTIAEVEVARGPVFTEEDELPEWLPAATVNRLHPLSRPGLIEQELLFAVGEALDRERVEETLRNLRDLGVLRREEIRCEPLSGNRVRIMVATRDAWSLEPIVDLAMVDAGTAWTVGLRESNLFGRGKRIRATFANRFGDPQIGVSYLDPRLLGSRWRWSLSGLDFGSGESAAAAVAHPFYSLETRWAGGLTASHRRGDEALIDDGVTATQYRARRQSGRADLAYAPVVGAPVVHRIGLFVSRSERDFEATDATTARLPMDRTEAAIGLNYRRLGVHYITERRIDHFDRPEYLNLGNDFSLEIGFSSEGLGADADEVLFAVSDTQGVAFRPGHLLSGSVSGSGRLHAGRVDNLHVGGNVLWVVRETAIDGAGLHHTLLGRADFLLTDRLDDDRFISVGESTGLRGYSNHAITGQRRLRATVEDRIFSDLRIADLLAVGGIAFVDTGYVWERGETVDLADLATGAGFGLRLAWPAAASEQVVRLDVAWPLNDVGGDNGDPKVSFLTTTRF
jgi:hypothetical protein